MYGAVASSGLVDLSARFAKDYPTLRDVIAAGALMKLAEEAERYSPDAPFDAITWQSPIPAPEKIICIGVNYPDRNAEYKDGSDAPKFPSMFMRMPRSFVGHNTPLVRPRASAQLDYEGEVTLVIGKAGRHIKESDALAHVAGYTCFVDGSVRDWQMHSVTSGKNFIGTGPLGLLGNVIWFVLAGWWLALGHLAHAVVLAVTIIGIPFAFQHLKLALLAIAPIGKEIVPVRPVGP